MACEIRFNGVKYTREEWDNVPLTTKLEALLRSPNLSKYVALGVNNLRGGAVFTEIPVAQQEYENAQRNLKDTIAHAKNIRQKIKDVFGKHMDKKQVEYSLILLDTMAQAWADRTGQIKEVYYERYQDVQQTTAENLLDKNAQFQLARVNAARVFGDTILFDEYARAFEMQENGVDPQRIKLETGWETNVTGDWVYEITDDSYKEVDLSSYESTTDPLLSSEVIEVPYTDLRESEMLFQLYPSLSEAVVKFYNGKNVPDFDGSYGFTYGNTIYINIDAHGGKDKFGQALMDKQTLVHETQHLIQTSENSARGASETEYIERIDQIFRELEETGELSVANIFLQEVKDYIETNIDVEFFASPKSQEEIESTANILYNATQGEVEARSLEDRVGLTPEQRRDRLISEDEDIDIMETIINRPDQLYYERGGVRFQSQRVQGYRDLEGNPIEGVPVTYETDFGELSYIRGEDGDLIMVREPFVPSVEQEVQFATSNRSSDGLVYRAAVESISNENQFILHAIESPDLGSLVHEFMHVAEQDLDDADIETIEQWSGFTRGTTEFRERVADGFVKFMSESQPELNSLNSVFAKIAKMLKDLYRNIVASPLDIQLTDDVRIIYARLVGVEQSFTRRLKQATEGVKELGNSQRKTLLDRYGKKLRRYAPSQLKNGTEVVKKDGSIGVVGGEDLSGTTVKDRADGITELLSYPLLTDLSGVYETQNKITAPGKPAITPSCT